MLLHCFIIYRVSQNNAFYILMQEFAMLRRQKQFENAEFYFQQDGGPFHYHSDMRTYLDETMLTELEEQG